MIFIISILVDFIFVHFIISILVDFIFYFLCILGFLFWVILIFVPPPPPGHDPSYHGPPDVTPVPEGLACTWEAEGCEGGVLGFIFVKMRQIFESSSMCLIQNAGLLELQG